MKKYFCKHNIALNIKFKNSHSKVFDKKGVCISEKRNLIESEVEKREPTKRNVNIIPSKNIIGNVELRPESRQLENDDWNTVKLKLIWCKRNR